MDFKLVDIFSIIQGAISLILILFLTTTKSVRKQSNIFLSLYLLFAIIDGHSQFNAVFLYPNYPTLSLFISSFIFLMLPALYLFFKTSVFQDYQIQQSILQHTSVFLVVNLFLVPFFYYPILIQHNTDALSWVEGSLFSNVMYIGIHTQAFIYFIFIFKLLYQYKLIILENYNDAKLSSYKWLKQLFIIVCIEHFLAIFKNIFKFTLGGPLFEISQFVVSLFFLSFIVWLILQALKKPHLFSGIPLQIQSLKKQAHPKPTAHMHEEHQESKWIIEKLHQHMEKNEPYLDANLTLFDLSQQIDIPSRSLSEYINQKLNRHFYDFVNEYRVKKAQVLLQNEETNHLTISEILYDVGFNSKSSFNTAFKKYTGQTPTQFRSRGN